MNIDTINLQFIQECESILDFMRDVASNDETITEGLIDSYENDLEELKSNITKLKKVLAKNPKEFEAGNIPLNVKIYYAVRSLIIASVFGSFFGLGISAILGGTNPELWAPSLMLISSAVGVGTAVPPFVISEKQLAKYYKSGKYKNKSISLTKLAKKLSKNQKLDVQLAHVNERALTTDEEIERYIDTMLTEGLSRSSLKFSSEKKSEKVAKLLPKIGKLRNNLSRTNRYVKGAMEINNIPLSINPRVTSVSEDDDLAISTELKPSTRTAPSFKGSPSSIEKKPDIISRPRASEPAKRDSEEYVFTPVSKKAREEAKKQAPITPDQFVPIKSKKSKPLAAKPETSNHESDQNKNTKR